MAITPKKRFKVLERDGFKCKYCGMGSDRTILEIDHIVPKSKGGADTMDNLITSCHKCNRGKGKDELGKSNLDYNFKIREKLKEMKNLFYKERNSRLMGSVDKETSALLYIYFKHNICEEECRSWFDIPPLVKRFGFADLSKDELRLKFVSDEEYQNEVIDCLGFHEDIIDEIEGVYDNENWHGPQDYCKRLNYRLTQLLLSVFSDGEKDSVLYKFSFYPELINKHEVQ